MKIIVNPTANSVNNKVLETNQQRLSHCRTLSTPAAGPLLRTLRVPGDEETERR